jgi:hypothetical protein
VDDDDDVAALFVFLGLSSKDVGTPGASAIKLRAFLGVCAE